MIPILKRVQIRKVEIDSPYVRVHGSFYEGGYQSKTATRTFVTFLVDTTVQPKVGDEVLMIIGPVVPPSQSLNDAARALVKDLGERQ